MREKSLSLCQRHCRDVSTMHGGECILLYDAESKMCYTRGLYHPSSLQFNVLSAYMIEQPSTFTEQYVHEVNLYFIEEPSSYVLLNGIRTSCDRDIFVTCGCFCLCKGAFETINHHYFDGIAL